jgi:hypothetical protein
MPRKNKKMKKASNITQKKTRELLLTVSVFLLGREEVKGLFWNVMNTNYDGASNTLNIGISTIEGKYGTTLQKLRKTAKYLSVYLYDSGLTFRKSHVNFYIHKEDNELARIEHLLDTIETQMNI